MTATSNPVTTLKAFSRRTEATYTVTGADPMDLAGRPAAPFQVKLVWHNGELAFMPSTISGWKLKKDGTPGNAVATAYASQTDPDNPPWLRDLFAAAVEPIDRPQPGVEGGPS
jgi:hypothetical protein